MPCRLRAVLALVLCLCALSGVWPGAAHAAPPDPRFGIVETYVNPAAATDAGAGYTRVILRWDVVQPASADDWKPANVPDPFIEAELAAGRQVVGLLIGTPAWAADDPAQAASEGARAVPNMDRWRAFVMGMARQYRGRIQDWVIWNEPDVWMADHPGSTWAGSVEQYYELLKTAYVAIKEVDPSMRVTLAGLTYFWDQQHGRRPYLDRLLDVIAADPAAAAHNFYFDAVVYHLYFNPQQAPQVIGLAQASLAGHGMAGKEIWINETNAPPSDDAAEPPWSAPRFHITTAEQAAFIWQEFSLAFASGANRVEVYKLRNSADHPESIEPFGLLRADDSRRPAFAAYQAMTRHLAGFQSARLERQGSVYAVTFDRGDQTAIVLWTVGRAAVRIAVPAAGASGQLVDEMGAAQYIAPANGVYSLSLPPATCACGVIGGAPRVLVEPVSRAGRSVFGGATGETAPPSPVVTPAAAPAAAPVTVTVAALARPTVSPPTQPPGLSALRYPIQPLTRCRRPAESLYAPYESFGPVAAFACGW